MPEEIQHLDGPPEHPSVRTEKTDASFGWILGLLGVSAVLAAVMLYLLLVYFRGNEQHQAQIKQSPFPLAAAPSDMPPPEPRLEQIDRVAGSTRPEAYYREANREAVLRSVGDTPEEGYVHIPIDRAMDLLANKLPVRAAPAGPARDNGLVDAGEPNSGRVLRRRPR
jgi:hypothetical protein